MTVDQARELHLRLEELSRWFVSNIGSAGMMKLTVEPEVFRSLWDYLSGWDSRDRQLGARGIEKMSIYLSGGNELVIEEGKL